MRVAKPAIPAQPMRERNSGYDNEKDRAYSYINASIGFVLAVFKDCQATVIKAIAKAIRIAITKIPAPILVP